MIYFGAPFLIGWMISTLAARQRLRARWPIPGLFLVAIAAGTAHVNAMRPTVPGAAGYVTIGFSIGSSSHAASETLMRTLVILSLSAMPYLIWRFQKARAMKAE
jgi:hypothetical protein